MSDHILIFLPSRGPNGIILNVAKTALPHIHGLIIIATAGFSEMPRTIMHRPNIQSITLDTGPAKAIFPNCDLVVFPATITAPGAMKTTPRAAANITPNLRPLGDALNSAQQP